MKVKTSYALSMFFCFFVFACAVPKTFMKTLDMTWTVVEVREDIPYERAWGALVDLLVKKFDLEKLVKEDGYIRTSWQYTSTGEVRDDYRVRVTAKFTEDKRKVEVKFEAQYGGQGEWVMGTDTSLASSIKTDIVGRIGRTIK